MNNFASKDEELKKLFDMFEKALKSLTEENNDLKERMTELNKENEDLKNITERFKDEFKSLRDQNLLLTEENNKLATSLKTVQTQFKQSRSESRQSVTTTDSGIKGHKQVAERVKKSSSHLKKKDIIVEARDSSEERSDSVRDITPDESQEEYMFKRNKPKTGSKRSEISSRQSQNAENLRASNHLLQQQNEALRIKTMLMEERSKMEHDDLNKVYAINVDYASEYHKSYQRIKGIKQNKKGYIGF